MQHSATDNGARTATAAYWCFYDGNGNVTQVLKDEATPTLAAHYEYDPYGKTVFSAGTYANANPIRFSTKWWHAEVGNGLYYYGYRYYSPRLGRWLSRDPIGEASERNLYVYVRNYTTGLVDPLGLCSSSCDDECDYVGQRRAVAVDQGTVSHSKLYDGLNPDQVDDAREAVRLMEYIHTGHTCVTYLASAIEFHTYNPGEIVYELAWALSGVDISEELDKLYEKWKRPAGYTIWTRVRIDTCGEHCCGTQLWRAWSYNTSWLKWRRSWDESDKLRWVPCKFKAKASNGAFEDNIVYPTQWSQEWITEQFQECAEQAVKSALESGTPD